jgi:hypothetical protein
MLAASASSLGACWAGREAAPPAQPTAVIAALAPYAGHHLLAIDPKDRPYRVLVPHVYTADGQEYLARLRICVSEEGDVARVDIVEPSIPAIDSQLPVVIPRWRYHPYVVDGRARPFCYVMNYRVG